MTKEKPLTYRDLLKAQVEGKTVQYWSIDNGGAWLDFKVTLAVDIHSLDDVLDSGRYRIKPKVRRYCNGIELDKCLTEAPELGTNYYYPDPMHVDFYGIKPWAGDADDIYWLELGFAYGSSESAAKHGHAMAIVETKEQGE